MKIAAHELRAHSITSSASRRKESRTVRPSAFAAIILMTSSNLVGDCTGPAVKLALHITVVVAAD
jgi:hypothetical protein